MADNTTPSGKDFIQIEGIVEELLPNTTFRVRLDNGQEVKAYLAGRMRLHRIRLIPGDRVLMDISPYDLTKGRITYRI